MNHSTVCIKKPTTDKRRYNACQPYSSNTANVPAQVGIHTERKNTHDRFKDLAQHLQKEDKQLLKS